MVHLAFFAGLLAAPVWAARIARSSSNRSSDQATLKGCYCTRASKCEAGVSNLYTCETCLTQGRRRCGNYGLGGRWDYCDFSIQPSWEDQDWQSKMSFYRTQIRSDPTRIPDDEIGSPLSAVTVSPRTSFDNYMREMPAGRKKIIHAVGSVCEFELDVSSASPYTGLLGPGRQRGLIRLGNAVPFSMGISPGLGFKFPRSGVQSGDFVGLHSLDFDHTGNFFGYNQSNHIPTAKGFAQDFLVVLFERATQCATQVGLSDLARFSQDGQEHSNPRFPFKLSMVPSQEVAAKMSPYTSNLDDMHAVLDSLPIGTTLYHIYACETPSDDESDPASSCAGSVKLGDIKLTSTCTTSKYGDRSLHIRHQRIEEDWAQKSQYFSSSKYNAWEACGKKKASDLIVSGAPESCNLPSTMLNSDA